MHFQDIAAIVTGGASGLGAATARLLATRGARVSIFDVNADDGCIMASEIGGRFTMLDVTDDAAAALAIDEAEAAHGVARIVVNCAGIGPAIKTVSRGKPFPLENFRRTIDINLIGTFNILSKAAARMTTTGAIGEERGVIINTASVAAYDGQVGQAAYSASKAGIVGLTLPVARDLASHGIRVMTIAPGLFLTPLLMTVSEEMRKSLGEQALFPSRLGDPSEYAHLVGAIVENSMLNGEVIRLDAAIRMAPR